jgi:hypothetical protein
MDKGTINDGCVGAVLERSVIAVHVARAVSQVELGELKLALSCGSEKHILFGPSHIDEAIDFDRLLAEPLPVASDIDHDFLSAINSQMHS